MKQSILLACATALALALAAPAIAQNAGASNAAAISDAGRPDADKARDAERKPAEMLTFAGVKPGDRIAELAPGGGYFTRIFARAVGPNGHVYGFSPARNAAPNPNAPPTLDKVYPNVTLVAGPYAEFAVPEKVDLVWTSRNYHDFHNAPGIDMVAFNKRVFDALKPGGIYVVLDHAAAPDAPADVTSTLHRIKEATVKSEVEAAGFKLVGSSNALHHASDDMTKRVFETGAHDTSEQFVLKFQKPN